MRIDAIEIHHVAMPLVSPWRTAYGEDATVESVLVGMRSGELVGWGEATPLAAPCYSPEFAAGAFACIRDWLAPALVGQSVESGGDLQTRLAHFKGNPFAKAALDTAWWVLEARRRGLPLHRLLGATRDAVDVGADFGVADSIGQLLEAVGRAVADGFKRIKLKYRPGWDIAMLRAVRNEFPTQSIHIDCNSGYRMEHVDMFCRLDDFNLAMIEQPLSHDDLVDHARLQSTIRTPICLDESVSSVFRAEQAIDLGSCRWINIKPGRVGGLTPAVAIHNLCRERAWDAGSAACWKARSEYASLRPWRPWTTSLIRPTSFRRAASTATIWLGRPSNWCAAPMPAHRWRPRPSRALAPSRIPPCFRRCRATGQRCDRKQSP